MKALIVYYSTYGHIHAVAQVDAAGVREVAGAEAELRRVSETLSDDVLSKLRIPGWRDDRFRALVTAHSEAT